MVLLSIQVTHVDYTTALRQAGCEYHVGMQGSTSLRPSLIVLNTCMFFGYVGRHWHSKDEMSQACSKACGGSARRHEIFRRNSLELGQIPTKLTKRKDCIKSLRHIRAQKL